MQQVKYTRQRQSVKIHRVANNLEQLYIEQAACRVDSNIRTLAAKMSDMAMNQR